ncbi:MAG: LysM peptidoglycan-binding domain-containing protein [Caldilineaceae bacterium]
MPRPIQAPLPDGAQPVSQNPALPDGAAAREQAFLAERLASPSAGTRALGAATATPPDATPAVPASPPASPTVALAAERLHHLAEYRQRLEQQAETTAPAAPSLPPAATRAAARAAAAPATLPGLAHNRWMPVGPMAVQATIYGRTTAYSGRVADIAVAPGGKRLYVATANGGVWRSGDEGHTWQSLMDAFDLNPQAHQADSQACGALALVAGEWSSQDQIYVGSGEAHGAYDAYYGVGPIVSVDGGLNWYTEISEPSLVGFAFYALAVDPVRPERVVGATTNGLYRREPTAEGAYRWRQKLYGEFTSVVAAHGDGQTLFYAARKGDGVYQSTDGDRWTPLGVEFPTELVGRIGLAVQPYQPNLVYALVAASGAAFLPDGALRQQAYHLHGLYRLDVTEGVWREVTGIPPRLFGTDLSQYGQGWYDLALAVCPEDVNRLYLGGAAVRSDGVHDQPGALAEWAAALYRCDIHYNGRNRRYEAAATYIGAPVHSDVHALTFAPGDSSRLYVGCDGGVFYSANPGADPADPAHSTGLFVPRNGGLATMTMNYLGLHPTEEAIFFCGTQDNGALRFRGDEIWQLSAGGDCGYCVVNVRNPYHVLTTYTYGSINRSLDGGSFTYYDQVAVPLAEGEGWHTLFYAPLANAPYDTRDPSSADLLAFGSNRVWLSEHFGGLRWWERGDPWQFEKDWHSIPNGDWTQDQLPDKIRALTFATPTKLYAGTMVGSLHRFDRTGSTWQRVDLPPIPDNWGPITSIAVDRHDASGDAFYVTIGGYAEGPRVWHFDGTQWQPRSGPESSDFNSPATLMHVQHNTLVMDRWNPDHLFVGADIGIWHSADGGATWEPFSRGLPDSAVLDLKQHPITGMLYAATHGRGVYAFSLYQLQFPVELYIRDHQLDLGRARTLPLAEAKHPLEPGRPLVMSDSPDIKIDRLDENGHYHLADPALDFFGFANDLPEEAAPALLYTHDEANLVNRVYVQVHSHGAGLARHVRVILLLATRADAMPLLPDHYDQILRNGMAIESPEWLTVGLRDLFNIRVEQPQVARFDLPADLLPTSTELMANQSFLLVAIAHSFDDPFYAATAGILDLSDRKVASKLVTIAPYTGPLPASVRPRRPRTPPILAEHRVKVRESLSTIAKHYYGDATLWPAIYRFNRDKIGDNPNLIHVGMRLKIPALA